MATLSPYRALGPVRPAPMPRGALLAPPRTTALRARLPAVCAKTDRTGEEKKGKKPEKDLKKKDLKAKLEAALTELDMTKQALASASASDDATSKREEQLWNRQLAMAEAQEASFEAERKRWEAREAALLSQLSSTQQALATAQQQLVSLAVSRANTVALPRGGGAAPAPTGNTVTDHVSAFVEAQATQASSATPTSPARRGPGPIMSPSIPSHANDLAAAVAAPEMGDVLSGIEDIVTNDATSASSSASEVHVGTPADLQSAFTDAFAAAADKGEDVMDGVDEILAEYEAKTTPDDSMPWDELFGDAAAPSASATSASQAAESAPAPARTALTADPDDVDAVLAATPWGFTGAPSAASAGPPATGTPIDAAPPAEKKPTEAEPAVASSAAQVPPLLSLDNEDIYWTNQLQAALMRHGYYCGEEELEDWYFGDRTMEALLTFQACSHLDESGITDEETWRALLGDDFAPITKEDMKKLGIEEGDADKQLGGGAPPAPGAALPTPPTAAPIAPSASAPAAPAPTPPSPASSGSSAPSPASASRKNAEKALGTSSASAAPEWGALDKWPVLMENDGGKEVHALHVALENAGYYPGDDDKSWWVFGTETLEAVRFFQAGNQLPESGVVEKRTWLKLLGEGAVPQDLAEMKAGDSTDDDMCGHPDAVFLIGEQRWEIPGRKKP